MDDSDINRRIALLGSVLVAAAVLGALMHAGLYSVTNGPNGAIRLNRLTGTAWLFHGTEWKEIPVGSPFGR